MPDTGGTPRFPFPSSPSFPGNQKLDDARSDWNAPQSPAPEKKRNYTDIPSLLFSPLSSLFMAV